MKETNLRAVLWDVDGTVLDSRAVHWDAWRTFAGRLGRPMTYDFFSDTFGFRNEIILRRHFGESLTDEQVEELALAKEALYREFLLDAGLRPLPGVKEWLLWSAARGWRQALASMAPRANIDVTLAALNLPVTFDAIVSGEEVRHGKPDPEVFLLAAERLGIAADRCVVIEDSPQGVEAAGRAGMRCVGGGPLYKTLQADVTLRTLADARPELLEGMSHGGPPGTSFAAAPSPRLYSDATDLIVIPKSSPHFNPILTVLPLQLLSCRVSVGRGNDPDFPRNLSKTLTVD